MTDGKLITVIHKEIMQECWHDIEYSKFYSYEKWVCTKCGKSWHDALQIAEETAYTSSVKAYWRLWEKIEAHEKYELFLRNLAEEESHGMSVDNDSWIAVIKRLHNPQSGCEAIANFFCPNWRK